ncbi:Galactose oxidase central domain containing protein [Leishmania donovani]|uniref:Galactose_oxidase_central_domain_containing_prote in_putative/Pfam:PF13418 n=1 Tax=Leishmania donovani TaxID=5661 RepID=A0A6J8FG18_LEIDO|nr:Galactose oxidase central domain containing protein [Leishmania donovani]VDZ45307.1 Galactose_oxidase_central_domain_containing_protein_putative/Pfam:PF13418 [Leishmania donovani]
MDASATPPTVSSVAKASTASANTATSPLPSSDSEDDNKALNSAALSTGSALPSSSIASSSFSMFSQSTTARRGEEGRKEEGVGRGSAASLVPTLTKRSRVLSSSAAATRTSSPAEFTAPFARPAPTRAKGPLPLLSTAALIDLAAVPASAADPLDGAISTDAPMHGHPLSPSPTASPSSKPFLVAPEEVPTPSVGDAAEEGSAPPAAPATLPANAAAAADEKAVDAGAAKCVTEDHESEGSGASTSHSLRCDNGVPIDGREETSPNVEQPPALPSKCLPAISTEPPPLPPSHASSDSDVKRSEDHSSAPGGSPHASPSAPAPFLLESPEEPPSLLHIAPEEQLRHSGRLSGTHDSGNDKIEEAATSRDEGGGCGIQRRPQRSSAHRSGEAAERGEAQGDAREGSGRCGQLRGSGCRRRTRELDTEASHTSPLHASGSRSHQERSPVCSPFPSSAAALDAGLTSMVGAAANDAPQQPVAHQHSSSSFSAFTHAHASNMKASTAAPSLFAADALASTHTMAVSSTQSSLLPTKRRRSSREPPSSSWPDAVFQVGEDEGDEVAAPEGEALQSSTQMQGQQRQEERACTEDGMVGKATVVAITAEGMPAPPSLPLATHAREATAVAVAPPPLRPKEHDGDKRAEALASASASTLLPAPAVAMARGAVSLNAGASTTAAPALSPAVLPAPAHPSPLGSSPSAPAASPPPPRPTTHHQPPPPPPSSAVAALAPSSALEKEAAAARGNHDAGRAVATSASAASVEPDAVPTALHPVPISPALPVPAATATAAAGLIGEPHREAYPAPLLRINPPISLNGAVGGSGSVETAGSFATLKSTVAGHNRLSLGSVRSNAMLGQTPLSMAQFADRWTSSEEGSRHGSDADNRSSRRSSRSHRSDEEREGRGSWQSHSAANHCHGHDSSGSWYSYTYGSSYSTVSITGSTTRSLRSSVAVSAPSLQDEREGAVTGGTAAALGTRMVKLVEYEEVTPVVRGKGGVPGWLCCGRKKATGGVRTSRMEVHRVCFPAENTHRDHSIGLSALHAGRHKDLPRREGSTASPVATAGAVRANITARSEDRAERRAGLGGMRSGGAAGSEGSGPPRGLGSATETPHSSEKDTAESVDEGVGEAAAYAGCRGSTSSYADGEAPLISRADTLAPLHDGAEETDEGDSGLRSQGEEAETAAATAAAAEQNRTPPLDVVGQAAFSSSASAPRAKLDVAVSVNTKASSSAHWWAEADGANYSGGVGVLGSDGSVPGGDGSAPSAVADAAEAPDHHNRAGVRTGGGGGGGVEEEEEGAATTASTAPHPLWTLLVSPEELPRLRAWDAEPPVAASTGRLHQKREAERLEAKYNEEAIAAAEEAQQAFRQAVRELMVRPPRQCVFVSVHGLRHWCSALHCPRQAPRAGLANSAAAALAGGWRDAWGGNAQAGPPIIEDPKWMDVRLAIYMHGSAGERLLAAGSVFSLPSNLEALRRCLGCGGGGGGGGIVEHPSTGGYGRDSWSDLLVFQLPESASEGAAEDMQQAESRDHDNIVSITAEGTTGHCSDRGDGGGDAPSHRASKCGLAGSGHLGSLDGCGILYVKLEERGERWVSLGDACAGAAATRAGEAASCGTRAHSPVKDAQPAAAVAAAVGGGAEGLVTSSQQDEEETPQSSVGRRTEPSSPSLSLPLAGEAAPPSSSASETTAGRDDTRHAIGATSDVDSLHARASADGGTDERAQVTGTRLEEYWGPLAVSPPLLPADLCKLQSDQPPLLTALGTTAEAAASAVACPGQLLPQLSCRLRWAQEPQPGSRAAPEPAPRVASVEQGLSAWASLGTAIKEYERVCRCASTGAVSAVTAANHKPFWPLTVLWNTIPPHLAAENDKLREVRKASVAASPLQRWCGGELAPRGHAMETLMVCSVVMRCAAAILFAHELADVPENRYCPPTSISVTGGCDGVVVEGAAAVGAGDAHGTPVAHRAPVMQYNVSFHAVLTRDTASSLLFTVHSAASPADVFGFAVWTPFDAASAAHVQSHHRHEDAGVGGVADVWLPLFAPGSADATPLTSVPAQQRKVASSSISSATLSSTNKDQNRSTTGLLLVGWLHCDVEAVFLPSLTEAAVQQLWNGPQRSLSSLAAAAGGESGHDGCCIGHGISVEDDTLVDFSVMEGAGLRPLATPFGMPLSPTPLRWDDSATWGNNGTCAHVYCEVLALQRQRQQGTGHQVPRWSPHAAGVFAPASSSSAAPAVMYRAHSSGYRLRAAARTDCDLMSFASESDGQGRTARCAPLSDSREEVEVRSAYDARTWTSAAGAEPNAVLPVTDSVAHTNHPRWQHTFRCGLALLSSLHLRVFDLCQHRLGGDGSETKPQAAERGSVRARLSGASGGRARLLGTTNVSSWLLRRLLCRPSGEGCAWLPLLWSPGAAAGPMTACATANGKGSFQQHFFPSVCNGFVLVEWRRVPQATAVARLPCSREASSWCASVTRRLLDSKGRRTTASAARTRSFLGTLKKLHDFPQRWYHPMPLPGTEPSSVTAAPTAYSRELGWITPEVVPWLRIHEVRLQWPWLQHLLCMHGGQAQLSLRYPAAQGETRLLPLCLLVPLCELADPSTSTVCGGRPSSVHPRETRDAAAVYGMVLSAAPSDDTPPSPNAAAPAEATLCLPASPFIEVQVWWYPRNGIGSAAGGGFDVPPRFIGRGEWRFPAHEEAAEMRGLVAGTDQGAFEEALNSQLTTADAAGFACLSDGEEESGAAMGPAPLPTALRSFFTPHEADLRVAPVHSTGVPQHVEGGLLTWRLMSVPRLLCDGWGELPPAMPRPLPESSSCVAGPCGDVCRPLRPSPAAVRASTWAWPDIGTPAVVHVEVCDMICFDHTDGPCIDTARATAAVQIAVSGTTCAGSPTETPPDESAAITEARCWMYPGDAPPPEAPRVAYALSPLYNTAAKATDTGSNMGGNQQQYQLPPSQASWALKTPPRPPQATAAAGDGEKSAARSVMPGAGASRSPAVEVQWPPRRFGWVDDAPPSLSVWVMAPPSLSGGAGAADNTAVAAKERVWGAVRLPGLDAFKSTSGVLWLPLFQSYAAPALAAEVPRCTAAAEDVALSSNSGSSSGSGTGTGTSENCGAVSPPPSPSTAERAHGGIAATAPPQSTLACGDAPDSLMMMAAPRAAIVVKHVGFVAVRYEHNMQRRAADAVTTSGTEPSAAGPRVLLVRVGPLHRRFPVSVAARHPLSSPSSPPPSESCTSASEAPLTPPSDAALTHRNAAWTALAAADNAAGTAAATGVLLGNVSSDADVLLGFEAHQLSVHAPDGDTGRDVSREASSSSRVAVFPLPRRDAGDDGSLQLRVQTRVGASAAMATNTMYFDPGGDEATPESAQWVPLMVRRRLHDAHGVGYDGEGESVVAELLVQWRVVDLSAATAPPRATFSPTSLQRLVRECCGGGGASCSYTLLPALSAAAQAHQNPLGQSCADAQRRAGFLELPGRERRGQGTITTEQASRVLSRVLRTIQPRRRRCVYLTLDQLLVQCSARQRRMWAALQRGTTASPQEMLVDGGHDDAASAPIRFRLEVQLRWPVEWSAAWRGIASSSPRRVPLEAEIGAAASLPPAAAASATSTAGTVSLNVWVDSGEGVFVESSSPAASGAAVADEAAVYASGERLLSCASLPPLCLVLPSAEDPDHLLGDLGLAARFCLTFALFVVPQSRGDRDSREKASDLCVGTGRTPMASSPSVQFGLTSLLPSASGRSGGGPPYADATGADAKDGVATVPPLLRWRARVTESLPVPPPASSILCNSPKVRDLAVDSGKAMGDDGARCDKHMPSWLLSSSPASSSAEKDEVIEGDGHTRAAGATAAPLLPRTPALAHVTVTRIELCGVDLSLARGAAQRHLRVLPPATVTVMTTDVTGAAAAPTDRRGGAANAASTAHQLLPCLLSLRPTAASPPIHATSTPSLPMTRLDQIQPVPPPPQRYLWSTDVCIAAPVSQLVFCVSVPVASLRSARVEEAWLPPRSPSSEAEHQDADAQGVDARWRSRHGDQVNVVGKAVYALDLLAQVEGARRPCNDSCLVSAAQTADCVRDVVLEVESLVHGHWLGRLWVQVDITAADLLMRDAASVFFTSRMTLSVQRCSGFAVGDVPLAYRAEETYVRLRERAALLCERRGRLPRRLRQQLKEIRQIRRQLRQGQRQQRDGVLANHTALSRAGVVRLTSAWGERGTGASSTYTSKPFALPTATELVRHRCRATTSSSSTCAPLLCLSRDTNTAQTTNDAAATVQLELCQASSGVTVAAGQMVIPLHSARTLWRDGAWQPPVPTVTSPLSVRVDLQACTVSEVHTPCICPMTPPGGEADVTATWAVHPARGDTWLTCICLKPTAGGDGAATPPRQLLLRWVYCFEATAYPETEHAVDMPLHLRSSSTATGHGGKSAQTPQARFRPRDGAPVYWSGAAMQLPRIGPVGATIKRVELLEVTPVSCAHLLVGGEAWGVAQPSPLRCNLPTRDACMTTRLALHAWTLADQLCFEARRRQAQDSGEDALMWLTCGGASAVGSRRCRPGYEVLMGLYTSSSLAKCAAQLLEQRGLRATGAEMPIAPIALATQPPRWPPHAGVNAPVACNAAGSIKADESSSPPVLHVRSHASTSPAKDVVVPGAVGSGGGVAMRALTFRCSGAAFAKLELGQVDTISCCVVAERRRRDRGAALRAHQPPLAENGSGAAGRPEAFIVVLDAGKATSLLQKRCSAEDLPQAATGSSPSLASSQLTATWLPALELSHSTMAVPCAAAARRADAHHGTQKARLQEVRGALLRVVLPLVQPDPVVAAAGDGKADDNAGSDSGDEVATMEEEQFRIEVAVRGRRCGAGADEAATTAYYVSDPLCASDIFRSACSCGERSGIGSSADTTAAAAGGDSPLRMSPSQWLSTLAMRLVPAPASAGMTGSAACESNEKEREAGPLSPRMAPTATMEVTWALDVLGVLRTSACAAGVVLASAKCARRRADRHAGDWAHRTEAVFGSLACMADDTDEDDDAGGGGVGMRQLEAYAAWNDFLAAQDGVEKMRAAQAELRHWRCTIVGVEVSGVELLSWCSTGVETDADTADEVYDIAQCTSLLAQLVLPIGAPSSAAGADAEGQPTQDSDGTGNHHRRRLRSKGGLVMGVARTTVTRMDRGARLDTEAAPTSCDRATMKGSACSARSVAPVISSSRPRRHRYTGTFTPLSWSMAVPDMIGQAAAAAAAHREEKGTAATVGGDPAAGLTVWQLLSRAPPSSSSARNSIDNSHSTAQNTTQLVYNLGATQLAGLLHECALYLVQVLARWLGDVYTTEEREALLEAAALYPTQWMQLAPVTPIMDGTQGNARVRFKCAYSYHGPVLLLPKSLSTVVPSRITAPRALADAVCCAQLDRVQLAYTSLDGAEATAATAGPHRRNGTSAAAAWPSRLSLVMRVRVTTERVVDGAVVQSRNVAQWHTQLAPVPCGGAPLITEAAWESGTVAPFAPAASSPSAATSQPTPAPTAPVATPVPVTVSPSAGGAAEPPQNRSGDVHQRIVTTASAAPSSVKEVVPLLPTTSFFCWQPPSLEEAMEGCSAAHTSAAVPAAHATETTMTTTLVEIVLVLADEKTEEGDSAAADSQGRLPGGGGGVVAGTVVGRGQLRLGCSSSKEVVWDVAEGRVESGWRLYAPLSVRLPVTAEAALPRGGCDAPTSAIAPGEGARGEPQPSLTFSFDLLIFTAPSMAQVAALQASRAVQADQRRRSLSVLQRTEEALAASAAADYHLHEQGSELNKRVCTIAAGEPRVTLRQLSQMWVSRRPYQLLRVPPIVIRVDTFAVLDSVPSSTARRVAALSAGGNNKGGPTRLSQTLWTTLRRRMARRVSTHDGTDAVPCPGQRCSGGGLSGGTSDASMSVEVQAWLVDEQTGEVRVPVWTLLSNGPPLQRSGGAATCNPSHAPSLASHLHAGRAILRNAQRLRLDWCSEDEGARLQSMSLPASLAGLLGSASVSYIATDGSACTWVSGGLRRRCAQHTRHGACHALKVQGSAGGANSGRGAVEPVPPLLRSAAHHTNPGRRRRQPLVPTPAKRVAAQPSPPPPTPGLDSCTASCQFDYDLYRSHFLSCAAAAQDGQATTPGWRCEAHACVTGSLPAASSSTNAASRLFHSATLVGGRIWLLGGWISPAGATTLPSTLAALVGTARLVERRRREVLQAVTHGRDNDATGDRLSPAPLAECALRCASTSVSSAPCKAGNVPTSASLRWCEVVQSVQCLNDGFPAPPVDAPWPSSQAEDSADAAEATRRLLAAPPRLACHVAVTCGDRYVAVFGGLMAPTGTDDDAPVATSAVHIYDTVQGTWSAQYEPNTGDVQGEWPVARYGHCVTPVPGTGGARQPRSYFVFGGATITPSCPTVLVPPAQLLWIWTPVPGVLQHGRSGAVEDVPVHSAWRRVQLPVELATPLAGRFLSQLHAYSAVEVAAAVCGAEETLDDGAAVPSDPGLTTMVLCVAGGMTAPALHTVPAVAHDQSPFATKASAPDAYRAFCECVEPWFAHPASDVASVLVACVCERQQQLPSLPAYSAPSSQTRTRTH